MGRLEIMGVKAGEVVSLQTVESPTGALQVEIDDRDVLTVSDSGVLSLGLSAGIAADSTSQSTAVGSTGGTSNYWRIDSLALQLWATASETTEVD